jgi:hypothetical protein
MGLKTLYMTHRSPTGGPNRDLFCVSLPSRFKNQGLEAATETLHGGKPSGGGVHGAAA